MRQIASKYSLVMAGALLLVLGTISTAHAGYALVTSEETATDSFDWSTLGAPYTVIDTPYPVTTVNGLSATLENVMGSVEVRSDYYSWAGNFAQNAPLLWNESNQGNITLNFSTPVSGAGAQIMSNYYGAFTAQVSLYGATNNLLETFQEQGNATDTNDNTAIFIGAWDTTGADSIYSISFSTPTSGDINDFAIGNVFLGIPETSSSYAAWAGVLVFGVATLLRTFRKKMMRS